MKSIPIENATRRIGAPINWNHETDGLCHTLEIVDHPDGYMISAWRPSPAELARMLRGEPVLLWIGGRVHPVVSLTVHDPEPATS